MQRTGGVEIAAQALLDILDGASQQLVLAAIFAVMGLLGLFISNTATAVLMVSALLR
ncbi:MAG: hypothetical protein II336_19945 [Loktanella sp.]|nr:hypothetical protein [Loktanella sp.]